MNRRELLQLLGAGGAALVVPATAAMASGTAYYVSGSGDDDNNGLTPATAFRSLRRAAAAIFPGDTVYVMNGDYTNTVRDFDGDVVNIKQSHVAFVNLPGHRPRIIVGANNWCGVKISASYVTIDGIEVAGNAENVTYDYAWANRFNTVNPATNANGIAVDSRGSSGIFRNITIRNCRVHHMPGAGIEVIGADWVNISQNIVHSCSWWTVYGCSGISVYSSRDIDSNAKKYKTIVRGNICYDNQNYIRWYKEGEFSDGNGIIIDDNKNTQQTGVPAYKGRTLVTNNLCYNNGAAGVHLYSSAGVDCVNNTTYFNDRCPEMNRGEISAHDCTSTRLYNNIMYARDGKLAQGYKRNVNVEFDYNIYWNGTSVVKGPHDLFADPRFINATVNPVDADFQLMAGSPAIGSGTSKLAPYRDIDRNPRPSGKGIDRGSYERQA